MSDDMEKTLSRRAQVAKWILRKVGKTIDKLQLMKLMYLADGLARGCLGRQLSDFEYIRWHRGPYDRERFPAMLRELREAGLVAQRSYYIDLLQVPEAYGDVAGEVTFEFSPAEGAILDYVAARFGGKSTKQLVKLVYDTTPMATALEEDRPKGDPLDMDVLNGKITEKYGGISLERVLKSQQSFSEGNFVSMDEAFARAR